MNFLQLLFFGLLPAVIGYMMGCPNAAWLVSRIKRVNLRNTGTKNLGTTNTFVTFGPFWALPVFLFDFGKAALAVILCRMLFPETVLPGLAAGTFAVIGHIFPFFLHFKGGKGLASYLGMITATNWRVGILALLFLCFICVITNYLIVASTLTVLCFPVWVGISMKSLSAAAVVMIASLVFLHKHHMNFRRLREGTEIPIWKRGRTD